MPYLMVPQTNHHKYNWLLISPRIILAIIIWHTHTGGEQQPLTRYKYNNNLEQENRFSLFYRINEMKQCVLYYSDKVALQCRSVFFSPPFFDRKPGE
jgi:hypothetical protein